MTYAKLHNELLASSIWSEPDTTRLVWVTMLLMSDRDGMVRASLTGLAHQARVSVKACTAALKTLTSPDPESRDRTSGERVAEVVGGYQILNYEHYQELCSFDDQREKARQRQQRKRDRDSRHAPVTPCHAPSRTVTESSPSTLLSSALLSSSGKEGRKEGPAPEQTAEPETGVTERDGADLRRCLSDLGVLGRASTKTLDAVLARLLEVGWTPDIVREVFLGLDAKTGKQRAGQLARLLLDDDAFERFNDDMCRRAADERHRNGKQP